MLLLGEDEPGPLKEVNPGRAVGHVGPLVELVGKGDHNAGLRKDEKKGRRDSALRTRSKRRRGRQ